MLRAVTRIGADSAWWRTAGAVAAVTGVAWGVTADVVKPVELAPETATLIPIADKHRAVLTSTIRAYPDFPKKGIVFQDVFPIFHDPDKTNLMCTLMANFVTKTYGDVDVVIGLDSRGFLMGPIIARMLNASFVPIRKKGKLPGQTIDVAYQKEYGVDQFEIQVGSIPKDAKVIIVDDLLATGGTMAAAEILTAKAGGDILCSLCVVELADLKGVSKLTRPFHSLTHF